MIRNIRNEFFSVLAIFMVAIPVLMRGQSGGDLELHFRNYAGSRPLQADSSYRNSLGQMFTVTGLKYYISNIRLKDSNGKEYRAEGYFLVQEDEEGSKKILLKNIPLGRYSSIAFTIGVDSAHNCSGAQSGALDPINGMFWAWNSGYVFMKMEGKSPSSTAPGRIYEYHIGGYKWPANNLREVVLPFPDGVVLNGNLPVVEIKSDVLKLLEGAVILDFSQTPSVTDAAAGRKIADNYIHMFSILALK